MTSEKAEQTDRPYPIYHETDSNLQPGLYLALFHGFADDQARQKDNDAGGGWGSNGPLIGPLRFVQTTYGDLVRPAFVNPARASVYGLKEGFSRLDVDTETGCLVFDGMQYGDWTVFTVAKPAASSKHHFRREFVARTFTRDDVAFALDAGPDLERRIQALPDRKMQTLAYKLGERLNPEFYRLLEAVAAEYLSSEKE